MYKIILLIFFLNLFSFICIGQSNVSFKLSPIAINAIEQENSNLYKTKIDKNGLINIEPGLDISYEFYGLPTISVKFSQLVYLDSKLKFAGTSSMMIKIRLLQVWKHKLSIAFGPHLFFRQSWAGDSTYIQEPWYENKNNIEYKLFLISGAIAYNYDINKHFSFSASINQINPRSFGFMCGLTYWISRKGRKCSTCPSFKN